MNVWQYNRHVYQIYEDLQEPSNSYEKKADRNFALYFGRIKQFDVKRHKSYIASWSIYVLLNLKCQSKRISN